MGDGWVVDGWMGMENPDTKVITVCLFHYHLSFKKEKTTYVRVSQIHRT